MDPATPSPAARPWEVGISRLFPGAAPPGCNEDNGAMLDLVLRILPADWLPLAANVSTAMARGAAGVWPAACSQPRLGYRTACDEGIVAALCWYWSHDAKIMDAESPAYDSVTVLAAGGYLAALRMARRLVPGCIQKATRACSTRAAAGGHLEVLHLLHEDRPAARTNDTSVCDEAARGGHLEVLRWAYVNGYPANRWTYEVAVTNGRLAVLEWLRTDAGFGVDCNTLAHAAYAGQTAVVHWAYGHGCLWGGSACFLMAQAGRFDLMLWACGRERERRCPWIGDICTYAARHNRLEILQLAREDGCAWDACTCAGAALGGHTEVLQWLRAQDPPCPWDECACAGAAEGGHLGVLQWLRTQDPPCPWNMRTCAGAAANGHLEVLQWARAAGCEWGACTCAGAADNGHLEVLQWAWEYGCEWDETTSANAARYGYMEVLQWALVRECPLDESACIAAATEGRLDVLQWLHAAGCPWGEGTLDAAAAHDRVDILDWARALGHAVDHL